MSNTLLNVLALTGLSLLAGTAAWAQGADHEKNLVVYASHPSEMVDYFTQEFGKKYGINVTTVKAGTGELLNRIRAEKDRPGGDVLWGGFSDTGGSAPELFEQYKSTELANIEPAMLDAKGYNTPFAASLMVIMSNSGLVKQEDEPKKWTDLTAPQWKGKVVHADPSKSSSSLAALNTWLMIYGRGDEAWKIVEDMTVNMNIVLKSSLVFQQVGRGEYPLGVTYEEAAFNYVLANTANIIYPEDGTLAQPEGMFLIKGSTNPNAAKLFSDYLLSEEAQKKLVEHFPGRRPTRKGIESHPKMTPLSEIKIIDYDSDWASAKRGEILARMQKIIIKTQ
ncbi:extracellular solute-binding protein [Rhizobium sp. CG4]|jgi:iron(III) transport system substrate-binding protein|uniref:extracellular solute-binding protein n=1 Tax=unclassified Rhizobium TaxID=2613769 RepID=UPI0020338C4E|nr:MULTISPECIES: extracellular solute-binding protein [unclassified Rhizobium]MCM2458713.1 extracellular solute-binding protein [Rhizobium sp. CG4]MCS4245084.1 iron(III) transport system substrate-binding protein [Rhizobium sp. BIGb0125]